MRTISQMENEILLIFSIRNNKGSCIIRKTLIFFVFKYHSWAKSKEKQKDQEFLKHK